MAYKTFQYNNYYFIGIGGIGMSALARYFKSRGYFVAGYDRTPSDLTADLERDGIIVEYNDVASSIPEKCQSPSNTLVIRTPAVPESSTIYQYFLNGNFKVCKRAEVLGDLSRMGNSLCVAGTHGKTSTSTILTHLLNQSEIGCNAFLGGISKNYKTNVMINPNSNYIVVEADEYDHSFLQLNPYLAIITSIDPDHLDVYGSKEGFFKGFFDFMSLVKPGGSIIIHNGLPLSDNLAKDVRVYRYGIGKQGNDFYAENITINNGQIHFDFFTPTESIHNLQLGAPTVVNIENSVAAMAAAWLNGVTTGELRFGLSSYSGVNRRFETCYSDSDITYIDDYAHHPSEIAATINSVRQLYKDKSIVGIFQPHLYSRTRDFADGFARELSKLDEAILLPIYPAREEPIEGISSNTIYEKLTCTKKSLIGKDEVLPFVEGLHNCVLLTLGAGDIDRFVKKITKTLQSRK